MAMSELSIPVVLGKGAQLPNYSRPGDGAIDLRSSVHCEILPGAFEKIPTGIKIQIPEGYVGLVLPRSGIAANYGVTVLNAPGLIDSNFRGEICVVLINHHKQSKFTVEANDRIAQLLIIEAAKVTLTQAESLECTQRGESGFGSSGLK
jgi:dUTP pyrophosphatase